MENVSVTGPQCVHIIRYCAETHLQTKSDTPTNGENRSRQYQLSTRVCVASLAHCFGDCQMIELPGGEELAIS